MDFSEPSSVTFHGVADQYTVAHGESISCNYTVEPSISSGVRDLVGIFPVGWQTTAECMTYQFAPLPVEYHPDQSVNCCISFDSERLVTSVRQAVTCQFCYISGTNKVQGMSSSFQLIPAVSSTEMEQEDATGGDRAMSKSMSFDTSENIDDDFVEVEDEDGEIVVIKSKTTFLEEELIKTIAQSKTRDADHEAEKVSLLRQLDAAQSEVERLAEENHSLQQMVSDSERRSAAMLSEMQRKFDAAMEENVTGRRQCEELRREMLSLQRRLDDAERSRASAQSSDAAAAAAEAGSAYHSIPSSSSLPDALSHNEAPWWPERAAGIASPESVAHDLIVGRATSRPRQIPIPAGGASGSRAGVEPRLPDVISCSSTSPSSAAGIVSSPSGRPIVTKLGWKEKLSGVGLNMFCHLRNAMDPFGADQFGSDVDEVCEMDRYSVPDRSPDGAGAAGCSYNYHDRAPTILRPPTSSSGLHPSVVHCPFCQYPIFSAPGSESSPQQQLLEHLLHTNCGGSSGSDPAQ